MDHNRSAQATSYQPPSYPPQARRRRNPFASFVRFIGWLVIIALIVGVAALAWVETRLERVGPIPGSSSGVVLIVGSDTREGLPDDLEGRFGNFAGERADVIILAHPTGDTVKLLSLPRDLKVDIPGEGSDKINAAFAFGGLDLLSQTIETNFGIAPSRAVRVDFGGFASIVDSVGGVEIEFSAPTRDQKSGLEVGQAGLQQVDGATALAYVRSRTTEIFEDGEWRSADGGDVERTARQRDVLAGIIDSALSPEGLVRFPLFINASASALAVDDATHSWNLAFLALRMAIAGDTESTSLPVVGTTEGGVSYLEADGSNASQAIAEFMSG